MQELLISIMQEPKSGRSWTSKVFNTVITLDTYQFIYREKGIFLPEKPIGVCFQCYCQTDLGQ